MTMGKLIKYVKKPMTQREKRIVKKAVSTVKKQKTIKSLDSSHDGTFNATASVIHLTALATTNGKAQLIGVRVVGYCLQDLASALTDNYRIDLVLDKSPEGALLLAADYLVSTDETPVYHDLLKKDTQERFKILRTWRGHFNESTVVHRDINSYTKLNLVVDSDSTGTITQANITRNALYLVCWTTAVANQPTYALEARVFYRDIV